MTGSRQQVASCSRHQAQPIVSSPLDMTGSRQHAASCSRHQAHPIVSSPLDMAGSRQQVAFCSRHQAQPIVSSPLDLTGSRQQVASCSRHRAQTIVSSPFDVTSKRQQAASRCSCQTLAGSRQQDFDEGEAKKTSRLCGYNGETDASMVSLLGVEGIPQKQSHSSLFQPECEILCVIHSASWSFAFVF